MMYRKYESAFNKFKKLKEWYQKKGQHISSRHGEMRSYLVDCLLFECLGWDKTDCVIEQPGNYIHYYLYAPFRLLLLVFKKDGNFFELPTETNQFNCHIQFFRKDHNEAFHAISDALFFCTSRGTPFGCISNGEQMIAFLGSRTDGISPLDGRALVFASLDCMEQNFLTLWKYLSKTGIRAHHLSRILKEGDTLPPPEKLSRKLYEYPGTKKRTEFQRSLNILSDLIIEDIKQLNEKIFLKECYCESGALSQYAFVSKAILAGRYSYLFENGVTFKPLVKKHGMINKEIYAEIINRRPILLLGNVGVGKTIFIDHFVHVSAPEIISNALTFYIDFGVRPTFFKELRPYLAEELERQLLENHGIDIEERKFVRGVYHMDIQRFNRGIYSELRKSDPDKFRKKKIDFLEKRIENRESHLQASLEHISKARKKQIIIFLDNIDQRPYDFQQEVFLIGQSLAEIWPVTVFVAIRPETFYRSKSTGSLSGYLSKAFTISPPRIDKVIKKRLKFAISLLEKGEIPSLFGIKLESGSLKDYLDILFYSFEADQDNDIIEFIDNVCGGNVRLALDFIRIFIGTGHVKTEKMLQIYRESGTYFFALHQFLRAIIYGEHLYFNPAASSIVNIFDISMSDGREHFLMPIILAQLHQMGKSLAHHFVPEHMIVKFCQDLGYRIPQIDFSMKRAVEKKLIDPSNMNFDIKHDPFQNYRITSMGAYYYKKLITLFVYINAMMIDTPIVDPSFREKISDVKTVKEQIERGRIFIRYLDKQWGKIPQGGLAFNWREVSQLLRKEMRQIKKRLK